MRDSMHKAQTVTNFMVSILGSFDHRLSALETAMRPTQLRTHSIRRAHENIDKTLKHAESILGQFDLSKMAEAKKLRGPHEDLESCLEAVDQLRKIVAFFTGNKHLKNSIAVINHCNSLLSKGNTKLEEEFRQLLSLYSKPVEPDHLFDCLPTNMRPSTGTPAQEDACALRQSSENQNKSLQPVVFHPPALIPHRILPLLHDLSLQLVQAGNQPQMSQYLL